MSENNSALEKPSYKKAKLGEGVAGQLRQQQRPRRAASNHLPNSSNDNASLNYVPQQPFIAASDTVPSCVSAYNNNNPTTMTTTSQPPFEETALEKGNPSFFIKFQPHQQQPPPANTNASSKKQQQSFRKAAFVTSTKSYTYNQSSSGCSPSTLPPQIALDRGGVSTMPNIMQPNHSFFEGQVEAQQTEQNRLLQDGDDQFTKNLDGNNRQQHFLPLEQQQKIIQFVENPPPPSQFIISNNNNENSSQFQFRQQKEQDYQQMRPAVTTYSEGSSQQVNAKEDLKQLPQQQQFQNSFTTSWQTQQPPPQQKSRSISSSSFYQPQKGGGPSMQKPQFQHFLDPLPRRPPHNLLAIETEDYLDYSQKQQKYRPTPTTTSNYGGGNSNQYYHQTTNNPALSEEQEQSQEEDYNSYSLQQQQQQQQHQRLAPQSLSPISNYYTPSLPTKATRTPPPGRLTPPPGGHLTPIQGHPTYKQGGHLTPIPGGHQHQLQQQQYFTNSNNNDFFSSAKPQKKLAFLPHPPTESNQSKLPQPTRAFLKATGSPNITQQNQALLNQVLPNGGPENQVYLLNNNQTSSSSNSIWRTTHYTLQTEQLLMKVQSLSELQIDTSKALSVRRGDLSIMQGESFRCFLKNRGGLMPAEQTMSSSSLSWQHAKHKLHNPGSYQASTPLVVKRLECLDRQTYETKLYECELFRQLRATCPGHMVPLYACFPEPLPPLALGYKQLIVLEREAELGDMLSCVVLNTVKPRTRTLKRHVIELARALDVVHAQGLVHGGVRPAHVFLTAAGAAQLGPLKKVELDRARQTLQFFSKLLLPRAVSKHLLYWAPELLLLDRPYDFHCDLWALGVTVFQLFTGKPPFDTSGDEETFRTDVLEANVRDWAALAAVDLQDSYSAVSQQASNSAYFQRQALSSNVKTLVERLLVLDPRERWSARQVVLHLQQQFAVIVQKTWRSYRVRVHFFLRVRQGVCRIQAQWRAWLQTRRFRASVKGLRQHSASLIQHVWKAYLHGRKDFRRVRGIVVRLQHCVLARQTHRAFLRLRNDAITVQTYFRRFLDIRRGQQLRENLAALEAGYMQVNQNLALLHNEVSRLKQTLPDNAMPPNFQHLESFENYVFTGINNSNQRALGLFSNQSQILQQQQQLLQNGSTSTTTLTNNNITQTQANNITSTGTSNSVGNPFLNNEALPKLAKIISEINLVRAEIAHQQDRGGLAELCDDGIVYDLSEQGLQNICSLLRNTRYQAALRNTTRLQNSNDPQNNHHEDNYDQESTSKQKAVLFENSGKNSFEGNNQSLPPPHQLVPPVEEMKTAFGDKWTEFAPKQEELISKLIKVKEMMERSFPLDVTLLQSSYLNNNCYPEIEGTMQGSKNNPSENCEDFDIDQDQGRDQDKDFIQDYDNTKDNDNKSKDKDNIKDKNKGKDINKNQFKEEAPNTKAPTKSGLSYTASGDSQYQAQSIISSKLSSIQLTLGQASGDEYFQGMSPVVDLNLCGHQLCFVSEVHITYGLFIAAEVEVYLTNLLDRWSFIKMFKFSDSSFGGCNNSIGLNSNNNINNCTIEDERQQRIILPDEQWAKYMRLKFTCNTRGGKLVHLRRIIVKGIPKDVAYTNCSNI